MLQYSDKAIIYVVLSVFFRENSIKSETIFNLVVKGHCENIKLRLYQTRIERLYGKDLTLKLLFEFKEILLINKP
jgi:hypothetical protein